jgi:2'-5' RNA ligase
MPRLFVAVDLPDACIEQFVQVQPPRMHGLRLTEPGQMHLTLHFLADADTSRIQTALRPISVRSFLLTFDGVGYFPTREGGLIAWIGVRPNADLIQLHSAIAEALIPEGYQPEERPFTPHITLARTNRGAATGMVKRHLKANADFQLADQPVTTFGLYSSTFDGERYVYRCEEQYALQNL